MKNISRNIFDVMMYGGLNSNMKQNSITKIGDRLWKGLWDKVEDGIYGQVFLPIRDQVWLEIDNPKKLKIKKWKTLGKKLRIN